MSRSAAALPASASTQRTRVWGALAGAFRYEFAMQVRRKSVWIGFAILGALLLTVVLGGLINNVGRSPGAGVPGFTRTDTVLQWTIACQFILTAGAGLLLADRMPRDRRTKANELLWTAPAPVWTRLLGKYFGAVLATLVPICAVYMLGIARLVLTWGSVSILPLALATFAVLVVPPVCFVGAFGIACTSLLWTPLYQFLFVGYWLWTNLNPGEAIPTLNSTLLSPAENYVVTGFFHFAAFIPIDKGFYPASSVWLGIANMLTLLACGALALLAAWRILLWQAGRG